MVTTERSWKKSRWYDGTPSPSDSVDCDLIVVSKGNVDASGFLAWLNGKPL